jgi:phage-related protein
LANVFDIPNWSAATSYKRNQVVKSNLSYYYSLADSNLNNTPSPTSSSWGGRGYDPIDYTERSEFIWAPSYGSSIDLKPKVNTIQFGDGYSQRVQTEINNVLLNFQLTFEGRDYNEALAIIHFLMDKRGVDYFLFTPPSPFAKKKRFICQDFPVNFVFFGNNAIRAVFNEVAA